MKRTSHSYLAVGDTCPLDLIKEVTNEGSTDFVNIFHFRGSVDFF